MTAVHSAIGYSRAWLSLLRYHPDWLRFVHRWLAARIGAQSPLSCARPWVTFAAMDWLDGFIQPTMRVFEWGSGGSTVYLARRAAEVISIEHDGQWFGRVERELKRQHLANCTYRLAAPLLDTGEKHFVSGNPNYIGQSFADYVTAIDAEPDASFDLVLIDGRARIACLHRAIAKIAPGGALVLDNSDYERYRPVLADLLPTWRRRDFVAPGPFSPSIYWRTTVWRRPESE